MAIEFNCPYCTASVRVPDTAGGKRGTCPKCQSKIIVPKIEPPKPAEPESPPPAAPPQLPVHEELPEATELVEEPASTGKPGPPPLPPPLPGQGVADNQVAAPQPAAEPAFTAPIIDSTAISGGVEPTAPTTSVARKYKKRRNKKGGSIMVPLAFGAVLIGIVGWFFMQTSVKLEGGLSARPIQEDPTYVGSVESNQINVNGDDLDFVLESLKETPLSIASSRSTVYVSATSRSLKFEIRASGEDRFFAVKYTQDTVLRDWVAENAEALNAPRLKTIADQVNDFIADVEEARREDDKASPGNLLSYRDKLGYAALTKGFGFNCVARVGSKLYPCVHQDGDNNLYFLLPASISGFTIEGRKLDSGEQIFTGKYKVKIAKPKASASGSGKTEEPTDEDSDS